MARPSGKASVTKSRKIFHLYPYAQISLELFPITGSNKPSASPKKMIATYFGYVTLGILLAIALIGAYYLGK